MDAANSGYPGPSCQFQVNRECLVKPESGVLLARPVHMALTVQDYNILMLDKYGRQTKQKDSVEDLVIANF